jgi:hypothetical protein
MAGIETEYGGWEVPKEGDFTYSPVSLKGFIKEPHEKGKSMIFSFRRNGVEQHQQQYSVPPNSAKFETKAATPLLGPIHIQAYIQTSNEGQYLPDINDLYVLTPPQETP